MKQTLISGLRDGKRSLPEFTAEKRRLTWFAEDSSDLMQKKLLCGTLLPSAKLVFTLCLGGWRPRRGLRLQSRWVLVLIGLAVYLIGIHFISCCFLLCVKFSCLRECGYEICLPMLRDHQPPPFTAQNAFLRSVKCVGWM